MHDKNGHCCTTARKACSNNLSELVTWALENGFTFKSCYQCDTKRFPFPAVRAEEGVLPGELDGRMGLDEGALRCVTVNAYERNPAARRHCIGHYGTACCICGFDFGARYGAVADGFIHVHHLRPLAEIGTEYEVDAIRDLRPVCPNCHAVIHLGGTTRSIDEMKELLGRVPVRADGRINA
jgi:hypothetical protein